VQRLEILPGCLGQLTSLAKIYIKDFPKLTSLPESMKNLTALRNLTLEECGGLENLPGWLGQLTSLETIYIKDCPQLTYLPESTKDLSALRYLMLEECTGLEILPGWLGQLTSLEKIYINDCPKLTCLPESTKNLTVLTDLTLKQCNGLEILPRWLGQLTSLDFFTSLIVRSLHLCVKALIRSLTALKELKISICPSLIARCLGEDAHNICHIPTVEFWNVLREVRNDQ
jgi:Leucine-rich repeat (LRR) protein